MNTNPSSRSNLNLADIAFNAPLEPPGELEQRPRFIPEDKTAYALVIPGAAMYVVEPSSRFEGHFFVSKIRFDSESVDCTKRPIPADWVEADLKLYGLKRPDRAQWRTHPSAGVLVALDTFPGAAV